jgi:hypothetical protein
MEAVSDVQHRQRAVVEFLVAEKESVRNIHKPLCNVYRSAMVNKSIVSHWAKRETASETEAALHDLPRSGCPVTAVCPESLQCADAIIYKDQHITT